MDPETFYAVVDEQLLHLERQQELPAAFLDAVPANISVVLDTPAMTIGAWGDRTDGPLVLALDAAGQLTSIVAVNTAHLAAMPETLASIDSWLATLRLRDLSELSGDNVVFYEGLWDLCPESSIVLSPIRRYLLLTALESLPTHEWSAQLPNADVSVCYLDVLQAPGSPALVRRRPTPVEATSVAAPPLLSSATAPEHPPVLDLSDSAVVEDIVVEDIVVEDIVVEDIVVEDIVVDFSPVEIPRIDIAPPAPVPNDIAPLEPSFQHVPEVIEFNVETSEDASPKSVDTDPVDIEADVIDLIAADTDTMIDLNDPLVNGFVDDLEHALVMNWSLTQGSTYDLSDLPLVFDSTGATLISISDELFAVENDIILVVNLPERRRDTPFEDRDRFRWDTSLDRVQLLNEHGSNHDGIRRVVHLFAESERQPGYAIYIGQLERDAFQTHANTETETAWFSIEPRLDADLYRLLKRGRLPQHEGVSADTIV